MNKTGLIYRLEENPSVSDGLYAALQHLLASIMGIISPVLVIGGVLGLGDEIPYLISMALMVSGVATFIQVKKLGPIGSGLLSIQGTSFAFLGAILISGLTVKNQGGGSKEVLAMIFAVCFVGSFTEIILSRFLQHLRKVITPLVTGTVVCLIGLSLIEVAFTYVGGGAWLLENKPELFGNAQNLSLSFLVLVTIIMVNRSKKDYLRMGSIFIGMLVGYIAAIFLDMVNLDDMRGLPFISVPIPFKYGFSFDPAFFVSIAFLYVITAIETMGDLTATSMVSGEPVKGDLYLTRVKGGILGDGVNSAIAATFNAFPYTTFSQNNGVIQMTGVASRYVGMYLAGILVILGLFPSLGGFFRSVPSPVIGGVLVCLMGTIAVSGMRILGSANLDRRGMLIVAISLGLGLGVGSVPEVLGHAPEIIRQIFGSAVTTGGLTAMALNVVLPRADE